MRRHSLVLLGVCSIGFSFGQVQNNSINDRIRLELDALPLHSTTAKSTVEWECVNKALTSKCLVYHNDQWYYFSVNTPGKFYLNISAQTCRDKRGIQVIIIEGNPCETSTYRILQCLPKITNEEVFIPLGELKAKTTYLIEMDGFLGDYCEFNIQVSTNPFGMPLVSNGLDTLGGEVRQMNKMIQLEWLVPASSSLSIGNFKVYRSRYPFVRYNIEREVPVERNAYGVPALQYSIQDTVEGAGAYRYQVYGFHTESHVPLLFGEYQVYDQEKLTFVKKPTPLQKISILLDFGAPTKYEALVYEQESHELLAQFKREYHPKTSPTLEIDFAEFTTKGYTSFLLLIVRPNEKEGKEYYFTVDKKGNLLRN